MLFSPAEILRSAPDSTLVCHCGQVTKGTIVAAITNGCRTLSDLKTCTPICPPQHDCVKNNPKKRCCCTEIQVLLDYCS